MSLFTSQLSRFLDLEHSIITILQPFNPTPRIACPKTNDSKCSLKTSRTPEQFTLGI